VPDWPRSREGTKVGSRSRLRPANHDRSHPAPRLGALAKRHRTSGARHRASALAKRHRTSATDRKSTKIGSQLLPLKSTDDVTAAASWAEVRLRSKRAEAIRARANCSASGLRGQSASVSSRHQAAWRSHERRSHEPRRAAASYVESQNARKTASGSFAVRTTS
jgi:hypothetical protein